MATPSLGGLLLCRRNTWQLYRKSLRARRGSQDEWRWRDGRNPRSAWPPSRTHQTWRHQNRRRQPICCHTCWRQMLTHLQRSKWSRHLPNQCAPRWRTCNVSLCASEDRAASHVCAWSPEPFGPGALHYKSISTFHLLSVVLHRAARSSFD